MQGDAAAIAVYDNHPAAEEAVRMLHEAGFDMTKLSIVGKDFRADGTIFGLTESQTGVEASLWGLLGVKLGWVEGIEVNLFTLVAGLDLRHPAVKLPGFGRIGIEATAPTATAKPR